MAEMNSLQEARAKMGLSPEELEILLGWPSPAVVELEREPEYGLGTLRPLFVLLQKQPLQCAHVLIEHRIAVLPPESPDREPLMRLCRKILGGSVG